MGISDVITLLGGVALFLFGMSLMGDGLKKVAGNKLELVLYRLSSTPLKGVLLGTAVTAVIQSSSATSVMVVGFVNSGMMQVKQAIGVVMGAILGTSVTGMDPVPVGSFRRERLGGAFKHRHPHGRSLPSSASSCAWPEKSNPRWPWATFSWALPCLMFGMSAMSGAVAPAEGERSLYRHPHQLFQSLSGHSGGHCLHQHSSERFGRRGYPAGTGHYRRRHL